jgi:hypothetical protein
MPDPVLLGKAFAAAAAVAMLVVLLANRSGRAGVASAGATAAVVAAAFVGLWVLGLLPHWPPHDAIDRLLVVVLPAAAGTEILAVLSPRAAWLGRCAVALGATPVLLLGSTYVTDLSGPGSRAWSQSETWTVFVALAIVLLAVWAALNRLAVRTGGRGTLLCVGGAALGSAAVVMMSGYATGGQFGVPLAAALLGIAFGSLVRRAAPGNDAAVGVGVVALFGLLLVARLFAELTTFDAILLFAAPLLTWLPELLPARRGVRPLLRLVLAAVPVVVAVILAHEKFVAGSARPAAGSGGSIEDYMNFGK